MLIALHPLDFIYFDVWAPTAAFYEGHRFYLIFIDSFTKYFWFFPMESKSVVKLIPAKFFPLIEKQFGHTIKKIYSDNGGEFLALRSHFLAKGINLI